LVEHPQHRLLALRGTAAAHLAVQTPFTKLWLALGMQVNITAVPLQNSHDALTGLETLLQMLGTYERQVVRRAVVLRVTAVYGARQAPDGKIKPWRAQLPLVVSIGREIHDLRS
jgi:hypothetical protein